MTFVSFSVRNAAIIYKNRYNRGIYLWVAILKLEN